MSQQSITLWFMKIREALLKKLLQAEAIGGAEYSVQIDESLFHAKRKYNEE